MRRAWLKALVAVLLLAALGALAYRSRDSIHLADFSWSRLWVELAGARKGYLLLSVVCIHLAFVLRAVRWKRFCRYLGTCSLADVVGPTFIGFAAMFVLGRAGEPDSSPAAGAQMPDDGFQHVRNLRPRADF